MPDPSDESGAAPRERICASAELAERGDAAVFDVLCFGMPARAFALRFDGRVVAYLNRCAHVAAELDWQPGRFLDASGELIICSLHGAVYTPQDGRCVGGPGGNGRLMPIEAGEDDGEVWWQPTRDCRSVW